MCHWKKWIWPGILTVAILSLLTIWMKRDFIQDDLAAKATAALTTNGQTWAKVEMDGRDAVLKGNAPSEADRLQAAKITDDAYEVRVVDNQSGLVAVQRPYKLRVKHGGGKVELTGFVPNEIVRGTVIDTAKKLLPGAEIANSLEIARGQPENFEGLAGFGLTQLAELTEGEMSLNDKALSIKGAAKNRESYDAISAALAGEIPSGGTVASNEITPPTVSPYNWSANYNGEMLTLQGFVSSDTIREKIVANAKLVLPDIKITDNQQLATGAPEGFEKATDYALKQLPRFKSGKVGLVDLNMTVSGVANSSKSYTAALAAIDSTVLPTGIALANSQISPAKVSPYSWGVEFDGKSAVLSGFVPDNSVRKIIVENGKSSLGITEITDDMQIADGAPSDITGKTDFAFKVFNYLASGKLGFSNEKLSITGVARDVAAFENANTMLGGALPAGIKLADTSISPATVSPYSWGAKYDGKTLELEGFVPNDTARAEILSAAAKVLPDVVVSDNVQIAIGAPSDLVGAANFSFEQLSKFSEGSMKLSDLNLSVTGVAKTVEDFQLVKQAITGELTSDLKLAFQNITPPTVSPYSWGADYDGSNINLTGFVPSEESRAKIIAGIQSAFRSTKVVDNMQIAAGAPKAYDIATASAVTVLPKFSKGSVALSGANMTVRGIGKTSAHYVAAEGYVNKSLPEQVNLAHANITPPVNQGEYGWQARKAGENIVLSGKVPSKAERQRVAELAMKTNPGTSVVNRLTFATGAPENFNSNIELGLSLLTGLKEGSAAISNGRLSLNGVANSVASYEKTTAMMKDMEGAILPPVISPYSWSVKKETDAVTLEGFVPSRGVGNTNVAASEAVLGKPINDSQRLATGEPEGFGNAAAALIAGVDQLDNGHATITDTNVLLRGRADSEVEAKRIGDEVAGSLPANYSYRHQISFPLPEPAPEIQLKDTFVPKPVTDAPKTALKQTAAPKPVVCTVDFMALIDGEKIQFDTAKAIIHEDSYPLLNRIAGALKECKNSRIEVGGHTDARGSERYNQELSEARAKAIVTYMTDKEGVDGENLTARGYGELQPIVPDTDDERAQNRRIEFKILDQ